MATTGHQQELDPLIEEFTALSETIWSRTSKDKHASDFARFRAWLDRSGRPRTIESLDVVTLLAYVQYLLAKPSIHGVWRGDPEARARAERDARPGDTISRNTVHSYVSPIRTLCSYLRREGILAIDPFEKARQRGGHGNPLLPKEETPPRGATVEDFSALERGVAGRLAIDLRDQAIVALMKTTTARNTSVRLLRLENVDLRENLVTFRRAKGGKTFQVALLPEAKAALIRYLNRGRPKLMPPYPVRGFENLRVGSDPGWVFLARRNRRRGDEIGAFTANGLSQMINERYHRGGGTLPNFRSHRIRHGSATILANNGMPIEELSRFMGHSSVTPTLIYAQHSPEALGQLAVQAFARGGLAAGPNMRRAG
ncbi:MAG: tyrosine-type recombinase/integrase [Candidatus Limnocylindrales bacterium]